MSNGVVHRKFNKIWIATIGITFLISLALGYTYDFTLLVWFWSGVTIRFFLGPDLDIDGVNIDISSLAGYLSHTLLWMNAKDTEFRKKVFNIYLYGLKLFFLPYGLAVKHRSPFSHLPVLADIIFLIYLIFMFMFVYSTIILLGLTLTYGLGIIGDINGFVEMLFDFNMTIFWWVFSVDDWKQKLTLIFGSSLLTFSHLALDGFRIRW